MTLAEQRKERWRIDEELFRAWVLKHNIGPGMNDGWRAKRAGQPNPIKNYTGNDGIVGKGWLDILDRLATDLIAMGWDRDLHQVKEKFGGLRFYIGDATEAMHERVAQAEAEAARTCEYCGKPGQARPGGWIKTLCDQCAKED